MPDSDECDGRCYSTSASERMCTLLQILDQQNREAEISRYMMLVLYTRANQNCAKFVVEDDETYLHDGAPYPVPIIHL